MWDSRPRLSSRAKPGSNGSCNRDGAVLRVWALVFLSSVDNRRMRTITVTDARKRFGALLNAVRQEPIRITRRNRNVVVVVSPEEYKRISGIESVDAIPLRLTRKTTGSRKSR